ncbi:MAG: sulfotransferase [Steroidobacteraceae bacterium]
MADSFRTTWTPPPRPEWVKRLNEEGRYLDSRSVVPLDAASLVSAAQKNTGLEDFGADDWREPFEILVKSYDEEADLNLMGRLLTRTDLLMFLEARLRVEDWYKRHPEIEEEQVRQPFIIIGQGRSGTSFLLNLLEFDPENATVKEWEAMLPCPPPEKSTYRSDPRIELADKRITMWNRVTPELEAVHEFAAEIPAETIHIKALSFQCPAWMTILGQVPTYNEYMSKRSMLPALQYEKRVLKLLQWKNPRVRWIMKDPDSIRYLPEVLQVYPDANFIWSHRDPTKARSSGINMIGILGWIRSDRVFVSGANETILDETVTSTMLTKPIEWLESGLLPRSQLANVQYLDLVERPLESIEGMYSHFGLKLSEEAGNRIAAYLEANPRVKRPSHKYSEQREESGKAASLFDEYRRYFKVKRED